jgi:hypothetical protein
VKVTSNVKGQFAVTKAELRALELGYIPSRPIVDTRYDLIIDKLGELEKVQVKYADGTPSNSKGAVIAKLAYEDRQKKVFTYQKEEIDSLIVYIPKVDKLCYFPCNIIEGKKVLYIRLEKSENNQKKRIIYAEDYYW